MWVHVNVYMKNTAHMSVYTCPHTNSVTHACALTWKRIHGKHMEAWKTHMETHMRTGVLVHISTHVHCIRVFHVCQVSTHMQMYANRCALTGTHIFRHIHLSKHANTDMVHKHACILTGTHGHRHTQIQEASPRIEDCLSRHPQIREGMQVHARIQRASE